MSAKRSLVQFFDRRGMRCILSTLATWYARRKTGRDISIFWDGVWLHRIDSRYIADSVKFEYCPSMIIRFVAAENAENQGWFHIYKPKPGDVIVDVGAGCGWDAFAFSQAVGKTGKVLAIEAHPTTCRLLRETCRRSRLDNVIVCQKAVADKRCDLYIEDHPSHEENAVSATRTDNGFSGTIQAAPLDDLCAEYGIQRIDFLKMNIEGAEKMAIAGMSQIIRQTRYVCIACHDFRADAGESAEMFATKVIVTRFLTDNGFEVATRDDHPEPCVRDHVHGVNRAIPSA